MHTIKDILKSFNPFEDKYLSREFQSFGVYISEKLEDTRRKSLYIKLAKTLPRPILEQALRFVVDSRARNKGALFMWKLKELGVFQKKLAAKKRLLDFCFYFIHNKNVSENLLKIRENLYL